MRIYAIHDANFDVTGITNTSGGVQERFGYTPYGARTVMNSSYGTVSDSYSFEVGFQGGLMDPETGLVHFDARDYDPVTGRWLEQDPTSWTYVDGPNLYQFALSNPQGLVDYSGLEAGVVGRFGGTPTGSVTIGWGGDRYKIGWGTGSGPTSPKSGLNSMGHITIDPIGPPKARLHAIVAVRIQLGRSFIGSYCLRILTRPMRVCIIKYCYKKLNSTGV